jgi:hypothetical protein
MKRVPPSTQLFLALSISAGIAASAAVAPATPAVPLAPEFKLERIRIVRQPGYACDPDGSAARPYPTGVAVPLVAVGRYSNGEERSLGSAVWSVDSKAATIDARGVLLFKAAGKALVSASFDGVASDQDGDPTTLPPSPFIATAKVASVSQIEVLPDNWQISVGGSQQFRARGTFAFTGSTLPSTTCDAAPLVTWSSSPVMRIAITASGLASAPATATPGAATVTATVGLVHDPSPGTVQ